MAITENVVLLICELLEPLTLLILGVLIWRFPGQYKSIWGYHSSAAERSPESWSAAQAYFGTRLMLSQIPVLILTIAVWIVCLMLKLSEDIAETICMIVTAVPIIILFVIIAMTEIMLKKNFASK